MADQENNTEIQDNNNIDNNQEIKKMEDYQNPEVQEINEQENNINENKPIENETLQEVDNKMENSENVNGTSISTIEGQTSDPKNEEGKIFVGGLNFDTSDENLRTYFSQFGELTDCIIMRTDNGMSRCFGFLTFKDPSVIDVVLKQTHTLDGKKIDPKPAIPREEQEKSEKIFVGGVSLDVTEEEFKDYFSQFGTVVESTLMSDKDTGRPRGFGFITFDNEQSAKNVLAKRKEIQIKDKFVDVKEALPKSKTAKMNHISRRSGYMGMDQRRSYAGPVRNSRSMNDPRYMRGGYNGMMGYSRDYGNRNSRSSGGYYGYNNSNGGYGYNGYDNMNMYYKGSHGNSSSAGNQQNYSFGYNTRYQYNSNQGYGYGGRAAESANNGSYGYNSGYNNSRVGNINGYSNASNPNIASQQSQSRNSHSYHPYAH